MRVTLIDLWGWEAMLHYVSQLGNSLARLPDVQVTLLLPKGRNYDVNLFEPSISMGFVDVVLDDSVKELLSVPVKLLKIPQFFKTIRRTRPDVLHLNNCHAWYFVTLPWLRRRYPIISTLHDVRPHPGRDDSWRKRKEIDALARFSHHIFVHSEKLKGQLLAQRPSRAAGDVTVIPLGGFSFFTQYQNDEVEEKDVALFFGRIRAYKGLEHLIEAAKLVARRMPDAKFVIAGAGDYQPYRKLLDAGAHFEIHNRYIPDGEVAGFFRRASIVVLPYIEASQSAVIPIAYAFGKPVVTTRVGCLPDVVEDGQTGLLVPPRNVPALAEAMLRLLSDDELRENMGRNAYRKMENELGWDKIAWTTLRVYRAAMQRFELHLSRN
jgi:glycosyltransferase involved in cell wall biosynthesis